MSKKEALAQLRTAKSSHIQWRSDVQGYLLGLHVDTRKLPLIHTDSQFGNWYYTQGQRLTNLPSYAEINLNLEEVFTKYRELYKFLHSTPKKAGLFSSQTKMDNQRQEQKKVLMDDLLHSSQALIAKTTELENELMKMNDEEFDKLI
ncbi:MAG: hypothetical protein U9N57_12820 [Pseudomonadota bacterium]|nr:hypothetical protein [Pseudomonadota bacterium]